MTTQKTQRGGDVWPVMGSRPPRVVPRDLSVQTDEGGDENSTGEKGKDNDVRCNVEGEYDSENNSKSKNQEREDLHLALPSGQVKHQREQPQLEYGRSTGYKRERKVPSSAEHELPGSFPHI